MLFHMLPVVLPLKMDKGGPRTALFRLCKILQWPMPEFEFVEQRFRYVHTKIPKEHETFTHMSLGNAYSFGLPEILCFSVFFFVFFLSITKIAGF